MDAWVLDTYSTGERMALWLRDANPEGGAILVEEAFTPAFYVRADHDRLERLRTMIPTLPGVAGEPRLVARLCALDEAPSEVLEVRVRRHDKLAQIAQTVDLWGEYCEHDLYDVDLRMSHRFLLHKGLFPFARVRAWAPGVYRLRDDQWAIDFEPPPLRILRLRVQAADGRDPIHLDTPVARIELGDHVLEGREDTMLDDLARLMRDLDPDVVVTRGGDRILLPLLAERARHHRIPGWGLGRDGTPPLALRKGRSYHSYGKMYYRPGPVAIRGRIHLDEESTMLSGEEGFEGLLEQARITSTPLQELVRLSTGTAFSTMQMDAAKRDGDRLIPYRKNHPETPKSVRTHLAADRGAFSFDPQVGVHEDVWEADFGSFFPRLMILRNLSPETVLCPCCDPRDPAYPSHLIVPRVGYHVCRRREGINAKTLRRLVDRRDEYKKRRKTRPDELQKWQARSDLLKMELVTSFGYQGHKNHRFGRIEVHESINAWARHDLMRATAIARDCGFDVLHGLADSLWMKRLGPDADAHEVSRRVEHEVGVPFEVQGRFAWLVLLPNKTSNAPNAAPVGALTRFYGLFDQDVLPTRSSGHQKVDHLAGGRLKVRGVELRQHSTPNFIRRLQETILLRMADAHDADALRRVVPKALQDAGPLLRDLARLDVPAGDLLIVNNVTRNEEDYAADTLARSALRLLAEHGIKIEPGEKVTYLVLDHHAPHHRDRVAEKRLMRGDETYDAGYYRRLAIRAISSLLLPFGFDENAVEEWYSGRRQARLMEKRAAADSATS